MQTRPSSRSKCSERPFSPPTSSATISIRGRERRPRRRNVALADVNLPRHQLLEHAGATDEPAVIRFRSAPAVSNSPKGRDCRAANRQRRSGFEEKLGSGRECVPNHLLARLVVQDDGNTGTEPEDGQNATSLPMRRSPASTKSLKLLVYPLPASTTRNRGRMVAAKVSTRPRTR